MKEQSKDFYYVDVYFVDGTFERVKVENEGEEKFIYVPDQERGHKPSVLKETWTIDFKDMLEEEGDE